jgi:cytochrome b561
MEAIMNYTYPLHAKILHGGIAIFGITAYLTGEVAENGSGSPGYYLHAYLGLSLATFVILRIVRGFVGGGPLRFSEWSPFSLRQWVLALQDLRSLLQLQVPERGMHEGLAGLTQAFGLAILGWMAMTGTGLFVLGSGQEGTPSGLVKELHEVGESLIPVYLLLHVGSVVLHSLVGRPIWQRMWNFRRNDYQNQSKILMSESNDQM